MRDCGGRRGARHFRPIFGNPITRSDREGRGSLARTLRRDACAALSAYFHYLMDGGVVDAFPKYGSPDIATAVYIDGAYFRIDMSIARVRGAYR